MSNAVLGTVSPVTVMTSTNGGHSPEQIAEMCVNRLIRVADTAPPEIAVQARTFRGHMLDVVLNYVRMAAVEDRATVVAKIEQAGLYDAGRVVRGL